MKKLLTILLLFASFFAGAQTSPVVISTNSENDLIPEGIAVDPRNGTIYITSIAKHKIISIDRNGKHKDFIPSGEQGFLEGLGMKVDLKRNLLWVLSNRKQGDTFTSQAHAFNLTNAKTEQHYSIKDTTPHLFNDLDIDALGNIFLTDTHHGAIYFIDTRKRKLDLFLKNDFTKFPNGIALGRSNQLYVATYQNGPVKIDLNNKTATVMAGITDPVMSHGLDGLVFTDNSLIGIYNYNIYDSTGFAICAVVRYVLDEKGDIAREEIVDKANPHFFQPTTLAIADKNLFVLSNSHLAPFNANKQSTSGIEGQLKPVIILQYRLQ